MPHLLGLTGNIACGKTSIGTLLVELGAARYIDADAVVHGLYGPGQAITTAVEATFGPAILTPDGAVDRRALGAIVFNDPERLRQLESIVHPAVHAAIQAQLLDLAPDQVAVVDAVKLLEGGMAAWCDQVWLVICDPTIERERLITIRGLTPTEADARLASQPDRAAQSGLVTVVIENSGTFATTREQVVGAWQAYQHTLTQAAR